MPLRLNLGRVTVTCTTGPTIILTNMASVVDDDDHPLVPPDSDEDIDWEEVEVEPERHQNIEVTLQTRPDNNNNNNNKSVQVIYTTH